LCDQLVKISFVALIGLWLHLITKCVQLISIVFFLLLNNVIFLKYKCFFLLTLIHRETLLPKVGTPFLGCFLFGLSFSFRSVNYA